jgi:hypothetical protein
MVFEAALAASDAPMNSLDHHDRGCPYGYVTVTNMRMALALNYRVGQSV